MMSFDAVAAAYIASHQGKWRGTKSEEQWTNTLAVHVTPVFGKLPVKAIDTSLVVKALQPVWTSTPTTALRIRGRIEAILDFAKVSGHRDGESPARWRGHLENVFATSQAAQVHHAALPYRDIPAQLIQLHARSDVASQALAFVILTAGRSSEIVGARWDEIDVEAKLWIVPASRMKGGREHRVPLSDPALEVIDGMAKVRTSAFVFPAGKADTLVDRSSLPRLLRRLGAKTATVHGMRSSFRDWNYALSFGPPG